MTSDEGRLKSSEVDLLVRGKTWEELEPGSSFRTAARTITEADLVAFVTWAGFNDALFLDASHGHAAGYEGQLIPAAMTYCIAEGLVIQTNVITDTGLAFMAMDLSVKSPVYVGDTVHAIVTITESRPSSKPGRGVVTSTVSVRNQHDAEVLVFVPVRLIKGAD